MTTRTVAESFKSRPTLEGAGVHLKRAIGFNAPERYDPFLLLDDFRSDTPEHYLKGFPWHPHRGIETITYVLKGEVEHGDSLGNKGLISEGDVQWMTAGSGIIHQEMPKGDKSGSMHGFQLWLNLPASAKMCLPRYQDISKDQIPTVTVEKNIQIRVICGIVGGIKGPVSGIATDPEYLDITLPPETQYIHQTRTGYNVMAYIIAGSGTFEEDATEESCNQTHLHFGDGDELVVSSGKNGLRFLFFSGKPLNEPIAWQGPIVMNSQEELRQAFIEYQQGTFLKHT